jgi:hypothetical protein
VVPSWDYFIFLCVETILYSQASFVFIMDREKYRAELVLLCARPVRCLKAISGKNTSPELQLPFRLEYHE